MTLTSAAILASRTPTRPVVNGFLLDTNIPSELICARPDPRVASWVYSKDEESLYLGSSCSIGELRRIRAPNPGQQTGAPTSSGWLEGDISAAFSQTNSAG